LEVLAAGAFTDPESIAAVLRITGGNTRLVIRLLTQAARIQEINGLVSITPEIIATARRVLSSAPSDPGAPNNLRKHRQIMALGQF
jgi:hypothetical protein